MHEWFMNSAAQPQERVQHCTPSFDLKNILDIIKYILVEGNPYITEMQQHQRSKIKDKG